MHFVSKQENIFLQVKQGKISGTDSISKTFDFKEKSKESSRFRHLADPVDKGRMEYGSL